MKIDRRKFVEVLEKVRPALGTNVLVPEFQYFQIEGSHIQTTDGVVTMDAEFFQDTRLNCSIPGDVLKLLTSLDVDEVSLQVTDGTLAIRATKLEGEFAVLTPAKFQTLDLLDSKDAELIDSKLIDDVIEGLGFCRFAASKDHASGPRTGVQINENTLFSTDRYRVLKWDLVGDTHITCVVPIKFIDLVKRHQSRVSELGRTPDKSLIAVLKDGTRISTCLLPGEYPDVLRYFPKPDAEYKLVEFGTSLEEVVSRHLMLLKDVESCDREILVEAKGGICTLTSMVPERSNLVEDVEVTMAEGEEVSFSVNPGFLQEIVSKCSSFKYFATGIILFDTEKLQYVMRAVVELTEKDDLKTEQDTQK